MTDFFCVEKRVEQHEGRWYRARMPNNLSEILRNQQGRWTPPTAQAETPVEADSIQ